VNVFLRPNLARCLWVTPFVSLIFMSLTLFIRHWVGMTPIFDTQQMLAVGYIAGVFGFLIGIGAGLAFAALGARQKIVRGAPTC